MLDPNSFDLSAQAEEHRNAALLVRHRYNRMHLELFDFVEGCRFVGLISDDQFERVVDRLDALTAEVVAMVAAVREEPLPKVVVRDEE